MSRSLFRIVLLVLLLGSCTDAAPPVTEAPPGSPTGTPSTEGAAKDAAVAALPSDCSGRSTLNPKHQITFVKDGRLFATSPTGASPICITRPAHVNVVWGPGADRFHVDRSRGRDVLLPNGSRHRRHHTIPGDVHAITWSHPTGKSLVYISHDWERLLKVPAAGGEVQDISFLDEHIAVAYHPAGTHIAVAGKAADTGHGIYLATNIGTDAQLLARGEDAEQIDRLEFSADGEWLYFTATHTQPRQRHIHALRLMSNESDDGGAVKEGRLRTLFRGSSAGDIAVSPFSTGLIAFQTHCKRPSTYVVDGGRRLIGHDLRERITRPVGWLPKDRLLLLAFEERCDETSGDLYVWKDGVATLLVEDVEAARVRAAFPPAPDPPGSPQEVVA